MFVFTQIFTIFKNLECFNFSPFNDSNDHRLTFGVSGVLRFVSHIPNTRPCDRVFGVKFYRTRLMTVVRKHMCTGDRNRKVEGDRNVFTGCSGYNIYYSI